VPTGVNAPLKMNTPRYNPCQCPHLRGTSNPVLEKRSEGAEVVGARRGLFFVGMLALALAVTFAPGPGGVWPIAAMQGAPSGELLYLNRGDIWRLDLANNSQNLLVHPPSGIITRLAHSPNGQEIAYTVLFLDQMYRVLGGDLVVSSADGRNP